MVTALSVLAVIVAAGLAAETLYRRHRKRTGRSTDYPTVRTDPPYIGPHPYLPFVYRPGVTTPPLRKLQYPLHSDYYAPQEMINSFGFPAPEPLDESPGFRVVCIGASTTMNTVQEGANGRPFSYPMLLEEVLRVELRGSIDVEVIPMAMGSWTSADIVVNFILRVVDLKPDVVCLYHANNDLEAVLTPDFRGDYSHFRRNLGETLPLAETYKRFWRLLPDLPPSILYGHVKSRAIMSLVRMMTGKDFPFRFPYRSLRDNLGSLVRVGQVDARLPFARLDAEKRNVEAIAHLCRGFGFQLIPATYAYYEYDPSHPLLKKYGEGVQLENDLIRDLARREALPLADIDAAMPREREYFLDACHLTEKGCRIQARMFGAAILESLRSKLKQPSAWTGSREGISPPDSALSAL